jgi:signal transduction histidine kinase
VTVTLSTQGRLSIADTGAGISEINKTKVFERFFRGDHIQQAGSGLGLTIAKWVADAHQLTLQLESNQPQGLLVLLEFDRLS